MQQVSYINIEFKRFFFPVGDLNFFDGKLTIDI